jgi:hypothetical protein
MLEDSNIEKKSPTSISCGADQERFVMGRILNIAQGLE